MSNRLERAYLLFESERYGLALKECHGELSENPNGVDAKVLAAHCCIMMGDLDKAQALIRESLAMDANCPEAHRLQSNLHLSCRLFDCALESAKVAIENDKTNPMHWAQYARVRMFMEDWGGVIDAAQRGLEWDAEHVECLLLLGHAQTKASRPQLAERAFHRILKSNAEQSDAFVGLGQIEMEIKNHEKALNYFREALRISPNSRDARHGASLAIANKNPVLGAVFGWMPKLMEKRGRISLFLFPVWLIVSGWSLLFNLDLFLLTLWGFPLLISNILVTTFLAYFRYIFQMVLCLSRAGRPFVLPNESRALIGVCLLILVACGLIHFWTKYESITSLLWSALFLVLSLPMFSLAFPHPKFADGTRVRIVLAGYILCVLTFVVLGILFARLNPSMSSLLLWHFFFLIWVVAPIPSIFLLKNINVNYR